MTSMADLIKEVKDGSSTSGSKSSPYLSIKLPTYSGEPTENILVWIMQVKTIFAAQGIIDEKA